MVASGQVHSSSARQFARVWRELGFLWLLSKSAIADKQSPQPSPKERRVCLPNTRFMISRQTGQSLQPPFGDNGHFVFGEGVELWVPTVERFLERHHIPFDPAFKVPRRT
jgi:hypothetical protein